MRKNVGKKMNKRVRSENSVQAYACNCYCSCTSCSCGLLNGLASTLLGGKVTTAQVTDLGTKAFN